MLGTLAACAAALGQQTPAEQDLLRVLDGISQHVARLEPMLQQVRPKEWIAKGAPETYAAQFGQADTQIKAIEGDMLALAQHPDHLQEAMKALFRVQAFHRSLTSVMEGLRKYQNPALAELISSVAAEDQSNLDRLQQYLLTLAADKDQQFQLVDKEAQRCRATLSRQPSTAAPRRVTSK